jgi:hypothetical protein
VGASKDADGFRDYPPYPSTPSPRLRIPRSAGDLVPPGTGETQTEVRERSPCGSACVALLSGASESFFGRCQNGTALKRGQATGPQTPQSAPLRKCW